jgi:hypothetical protein
LADLIFIEEEFIKGGLHGFGAEHSHEHLRHVKAAETRHSR